MDRADLAPGARNRALALLAVALVLSMTTWFSASAVVPQLREEWGLGSTAAAWLTIAVQLGFVAGALVSAVLNVADVVSPRLVILVGATGAAGANALLGLVSGPGGAIPLRFLTGFFLAGVYPPALKLMATWFRRGRGTALGILVGALTLGSATPHLVNALGSLDWHTVVYATSALTFAGGLLALAVRDGPYPFPQATFDPHQARRVFANRGVRLSSLGYFGHMWELYAMWAWFVVFYSTVVAGGAEAALRDLRGDRRGRGRLLGRRACSAIGSAGRRRRRSCMAVSGACALLIGLFADAPAMGRPRDRARLGVHRRGGLGPVLDPRHGARRPGVRRDGADDAARRRLHADGGDDLAAAVPRGRRRLALGLRLPRPRAGARRRRDAAAPRRGAPR